MKKPPTKTTLSTRLRPDLDGIRAKVERRREYLELLETELSNTRRNLQQFTDVYNQRVAPLEKQQARLRQMLEELLADQAPPDSGWLAGRASRSYWAGGAAAADEEAGAEDAPAVRKVTAKDADQERELRELFRQLAKRYHPDVARNAHEKEQHEAIMAQINQAYMNKDLDTLQTIAKSYPAVPGGLLAPEAEFARLTLELRQLDTQIFEVENTIRELDLSPAMQMHTENKAERNRRDIFADMESQYRTRINELEERLLGLGVEPEDVLPN